MTRWLLPLCVDQPNKCHKRDSMSDALYGTIEGFLLRLRSFGRLCYK